jgi:hypothetical protein
MNSFPNYRSGGAPNVLFLEYRSKIQNDWKLLKGHVLVHSNLASSVTDIDCRRCSRPVGQVGFSGWKGARLQLRRRAWFIGFEDARTACAFLIFLAALGSQVIISVASRERRNPAAVK